MNWLTSGWSWISGEPKQLRGVRILQVCIGCMLLCRLLTELPFAKYLWGPRGLGYGSTEMMFGETLGGLLGGIFSTLAGTYALLFALAVGAFGLVIGRHTRIATGLALFAYLLVEFRLPELGDGGDNIARLVLCYMLFLLPVGARSEPGKLGAWLHNLAIVAIGAQLLIMYFTSGMMKAHGAAWHNGTAIYLVAQVEWFSHPAIRDVFSIPVVAMVVTYSAMIIQIWFPVAMFSRLKLAWLAVGISMHVGIALFMGLIHFSTVMVGLELFLITDAEWGRIGQGAHQIKARLSRRFSRPTLRPSHLLFIDGFCRKCRTAGARIERIDGHGRVELSSFRHDDRYRDFGITAEQLERRMHIVNVETGSVASGFAAVRELARLLTPLWPLRPALATLDRLGLGDRIYDAMASGRAIVPEPTACDTSCRETGGQ